MATPPTERTALTSRKPDEPIAYDHDGARTVGDLLNQATVLAARLPEEKYSINLHRNRYEYLRGFCAALLAGHSTLMPPNRQPGTLAEIPARYPDPKDRVRAMEAYFKIVFGGKVMEMQLSNLDILESAKLSVRIFRFLCPDNHLPADPREDR